MRVAMVIVSVLVLTTCFILVIGLRPLVDVLIRGTIDVRDLPKARPIDVRVDRHEGSSTHLLGKISIPSTCLVVKPELTSYDGNFTLVVSSTLDLRSSNTSYSINIPCMVAVGEPCYRVMILIPGYDTPLCIGPGEYSLELTITWKALGKGSFTARLTLYESS